MKFVCKEIAIIDSDFGCEVTLSDRADQDNIQAGQTVEEIVNSLGQYILLQRTYSEDEFDSEYVYFETSDFEKSGELLEFELVLSRTKFMLTVNHTLYDIGIDIDNQKYDELRTTLSKITRMDRTTFLED